MNFAINFLVMMTLFFAGMAQAKAMNAHAAYAIAGCTAAVGMALAIARYRKQKGGK